MTPAELRAERERMFAATPADVTALAAGEGPLQPLGRLFAAESDTRVYGELLGALVLEAKQGDGTVSPAALATATWLLERLARRCAGWYDLPAAARTLEGAAALLPRLEGDERLEALEQVALLVDRLAMWLDVEIPWAALNDALLAWR